MAKSSIGTAQALPLILAGLLGLGVVAPPAALAQFSDTYKFLESVRKSDNEAVIKAVETPGVTPINTRDRTTGETALMIVIGRRDLTWTNYLVQHGARLDLADNTGRTPLMLAVEKRFPEAVELLLTKRANPNQTNDSGETPLIRAVQLGDMDSVRLLLAGGADPNRKDTLAGLSAIDYAKRDNRNPALLDLLNTKAKAAPSKGVQGPHL